MATQRGRGEFGYGSLDNQSESAAQHQDGQFGTGQGNDFADMAQQVSSAIYKISSNVSTLEKAVRQIGTPSDSNMLRNKIQANLQTTNKIVGETTMCIKDLSVKARTLGKSSRLQVDRLANEYQESVQRYGAVQKKVSSKMRSCPNIPPKAPPTSPGKDLVAYDDSQASMIEDARRQEIQSQLQQQDQQIDYDMNLLQEREEQIRQIEASMLDVNEIFRDLSAMVSEQGEVVDSIEANIMKADDNVVSANTELQTASMYQKKARKKMCCCFVVMVIVALIIAIILIVKLTSS